METQFNNGQGVEILLVEDNPGDARLVQEGMAQASVKNTVHHVRDGVEALAFLNHEPRYANVPRPDLIVLDLNLPGLDGRDVLTAIKGDARLRTIPVVVFTTSSADADVLKSYDLQASCYVTKPVNFEQFMKTIRDIESFWLGVVRLPA